MTDKCENDLYHGDEDQHDCDGTCNTCLGLDETLVPTYKASGCQIPVADGDKADSYVICNYWAAIEDAELEAADYWLSRMSKSVREDVLKEYNDEI